MNYISTRGGGEPRDFEQALLSGLAPDGGLYVPESWPRLDLDALKGKPYIDVAIEVMYPFVEGSLDRDEFATIVRETYGPEFFRHKDVVPLHPLKDNHYILEQFHGPTIAFKDVALQLLGRLFDHVLKKRGEHITIVGATSGDTGSAAIEGCKVSDQLDIFILHPKGRVSDVQRRQMTTVEGENVHNIALEGSFDDCQNMVKAMFNDAEFRKEMNLAAVNSINWARVMAQIVYYVTSALELGAPDKQVTYVVPTGNYGNVFAAYCARKMGLPIKLVVATNENDILTRFFESGQMKAAGCVATITPSMDIEISSNFERYLFDLLDRDEDALAAMMRRFKDTGHFEVSPEQLARAREDFAAGRTDQSETLATIKQVYEDTDYILDPHTAVAMKVALDVAPEVDGPVVTLATAHPAKFPDAVEKAIGLRPALPEHLADLFDRAERLEELPNDIKVVQDFVREHSHISKQNAA
ncbi:MAG TPA: threonine synthase [Alphaproteobacteria bacterium]|nr:threonine synthase [Alphaproteobacteria bacterium]USO06731.1 MAG: threonine synthase [Rhodospirillales bacterium]HOO82357.1 threonine synthase [Alphaproteobacteria bacterium]